MKCKAVNEWYSYDAWVFWGIFGAKIIGSPFCHNNEKASHQVQKNIGTVRRSLHKFQKQKEETIRKMIRIRTRSARIA